MTELSRPGERLVTLMCGTQVSNYSEEWRAECEAAEVSYWTAEERQQYLAKVAQKRSQAAADAIALLVCKIKTQREARRVAKLPTKRERREYLDEVEQVRGYAIRRDLEEELTRIWQARQAA